MSTLEQQEASVESGIQGGNESFVEDIVNEQSISQEVDTNQQEFQEEVPAVDYEAESKKFQSMYDRSQAENSKLLTSILCVHDSLLVSQCNRNFSLLQLFQLITKQQTN